jgi:hypothetical protein
VIGKEAPCPNQRRTLAIRLRTFVSPSRSPTDGHCSINEVAAFAKWVKAAGMSIMLDYGTSALYNSWNIGVTVSDSQFQSSSTSGWDAPRQSDGSLPVLPYLRLAATSTLIDKGANVGLPYSGSAPDLGAFETSK